MLITLYFVMLTVVIFTKTDGAASWVLFFVSGSVLTVGFFCLKALGNKMDEEDDYVH